LAVITDGVIEIENIQPMFAPNIEKEKLKNFLDKNRLLEDKLELAGNILLVMNGERNILIDTGSGALLSPSTGKLIENLKNLGITLRISRILSLHTPILIILEVLLIKTENWFMRMPIIIFQKQNITFGCLMNLIFQKVQKISFQILKFSLRETISSPSEQNLIFI
jgi:hypothetical protein